MENGNQHQFVDDLLEASLARYSSVTPRPGLDGRVLAHAKAAQERRSWFMWAGWLAAGAAAALIVVGAFSLRHRFTIPATPKTAAVVKPSMATEPRPSTVSAKPIHQAHTPRRPPLQRMPQANSLLARAEVRLPVFPSPSPLSKQEELLVACLKLAPETQEEIFSKSQDTAEELEIKPLPPLADDSEGPEGEIDH